MALFGVYKRCFNDLGHTVQMLSPFEKVVQSNSDFRLNDGVDINITHIAMPHGSKQKFFLGSIRGLVTKY